MLARPSSAVLQFCWLYKPEPCERQGHEQERRCGGRPDAVYANNKIRYLMSKTLTFSAERHSAPDVRSILVYKMHCWLTVYNPLFHTLPLSQSGMRGPDQVRLDLHLSSHTFYVPSPPPFPLHHPAPGIYLHLPSQIRLPRLLSTQLCYKSLKAYLLKPCMPGG